MSRSAAALAALGAASALAACVSGDPVEGFRAARQAGTPEAYEAFVARHPRNPLARVALEELDELREQRDWEAAERDASAAGYERFIAAHPNAYRALAARRLRDELRERDAWRSARDADDAEAYAAFLRRYPASASAAEAGRRLEALARWDFAERVREQCTRTSAEAGEPVAPVYAFVPHAGPPFAVVKDAEQRYWTLRAEGDAQAEPYWQGVDAPALGGAPPHSGAVIFASWDWIASAHFGPELEQLRARTARELGVARVALFAAPDAPPRPLDERGMAATWFGTAGRFSEQLRSADPAERVRAAQALGLLRERGATDALLAAWNDPEREVGTAVAVALLRLRSGYAAVALRRAAAARVEPLVAALGHWDRAVVDRARQQLVAIGAPAVPALTAELDRPLARGAAEIARTLGEIGDPRAVAALTRRLGDAPHTRDAAQRALARIRAE